VEEVKRILMNNPNLDVNWKNMGESDVTALIRACENGHNVIVSILLAHPEINANPKVLDSDTPFLRACRDGHTSCVRLLLKDQRVEINEPDSIGHTPLYWAASGGFLDIVRWWVASGREMDVKKPAKVRMIDIGEELRKRRAEVVTLLGRLHENPNETRHAMRLELGWYDEAAAEMFALMVFVSDGLLQVKDTTPTPAARFLSIARGLPLELQMVLCHRVVGSPKEIIRAQDSEVAFKSLAESLLWHLIFTTG